MPNLGKERAEAVRAELDAIEDLNGGDVTPEAVFRAAHRKDSVLHTFFEWDKNRAFIECNLTRARELIGMLKDRHTLNASGMTVDVRTYQYLPSTESYRKTLKALSRKETREEILRSALWELESFRAKYAALRELAGVHDVIDATLKKLGNYAQRSA